MRDTHDYNADVYDVAYAPYFPPEKTAAELERMRSLLPEHGRVLDLGCGTGRHLVPLAKEGYRVTGVDSSEGMLKACKRKLAEAGAKARLIHGDATTAELGGHYGLAVIMWNAFCELAPDEGAAVAFLRRINDSLAEDGMLLIQQHDPDVFSEGQESHYDVVDGDTRYTVSWYVREKHDKTTVSEEQLTIRSPDREEKRVSELRQRWYSRTEYAALLLQAGFLDVRFEGEDEFLIIAKGA